MSTQNKTSARVGCGRLVRATHRFIIGIGWTDLGTAFALILIGGDCLKDGRSLCGLWCWMLGITIYIRAPRPNAKSEPRGPKL